MTPPSPPRRDHRTGAGPRLQRLRGYWGAPPHPNPLVDQALARTYILDTRDTPLTAGVMAAVYWITFYVLTRRWEVLAWVPLVHGMQWHMYRHLHGTDPEAIGIEDAAAWRRRLEGRMLLPGVIWALAPWCFYTEGNLALTVLLYFCIAGMTAAAASALAQWWRACVCFTVPVFMSLALRLLTAPGGLTHLVGVLAIVHMLSTLHYGRKQGRMIVQSIETGFENARLAAALSRQLDHVAQLAAQRARIFAAANHDLRQPLHALAIFVDALHPQRLPAADSLRYMRDSVDALRTSVDALLDIAQLDSGAAPRRLEPVPLAPLFDSLRGRFGALATAKGLQLRVRGSGAVVRADARMLSRLLGNLVDNAIKYTPQGAVLVAARRQRRPGAASAWRIEVRDTGIGIGAEYRERVFEEFFQVDNPGRDRARGLGLGLSLVSSMAQAMGSSIGLRSAPGRGSVFSLLLEEGVPAPAPASGAPPEVPQAQRTARLLVLDDEQPVREAMRTLLTGWGHEVAVAADPREALQQPGVFDLLLCDLRLGSGLSGLSAAQALQAVGKVCSVAILTGETAHASRAEVEAAGYPLIFKPADIQALRAAIGAATSAAPVS